MRSAILSDVHANIEALEAVLKRIEKERVDEIICLGDMVGYGPNPNECIELIRSVCSIVILGNHDEWVLKSPDHSRVPESVWQSIQWTANQVEDRHKAWIAGLPLIVHRGKEIFVHASPLFPDRWEYITDEASCLKYFPVIGTSRCYVGHSHVPGRFLSPRKFRDGEDETPLGGGEILNVGSVGQPRDGDPGACFLVSETIDGQFLEPRFVRVPYETGPVSTKILLAGLSDFFAYRISVGR